MRPVLYADFRCLQELRYRVRGIGHHVASLLRGRAKSNFADVKLIGLVDPALPDLPVSCSYWADGISASLNPVCNGTSGLFIDWTPMTHDPRFSLRFQGQTKFSRAAVLYDFIPLDWPGYLPTVAQRIEYLGKVARLRSFDLFASISDYTAWRASQLLGVPLERFGVTGASVRHSLYELAETCKRSRDELYFLIVIAEDPRKIYTQGR